MVIEILRSFRIGAFSVFDFATAYLGIYLVAPALSKLFRKMDLQIPRATWLWFTLPIAILIHLGIGLRTPLTKMVLDPNGYYLLKVVIFAMFVMGIRLIRKVRPK